jgi:hypothetical protein
LWRAGHARAGTYRGNPFGGFLLRWQLQRREFQRARTPARRSKTKREWRKKQKRESSGDHQDFRQRKRWAREQQPFHRASIKPIFRTEASTTCTSQERQ